MSYLFEADLTSKQSKLTIDRLVSLVQTTHYKRVERIAYLQAEMQTLMDYIEGLLKDELAYQSRMSLLPSVSSGAGALVNGVLTPNMLSTLPEFKRDSYLKSLKLESPLTDLINSPNIIVKDAQIVLAYNQMMSVLNSVYKYIKLHEHRILSARLQLQSKMRLVELLQEEQQRVLDSEKSAKPATTKAAP